MNTPPDDNAAHADLRDEAAQWSTENAPPEPPRAPSSPPPTPEVPGAQPAAESDDESDDDEETDVAPPSPKQLQLAEQLSTLGWQLLDTFVPKQFGQRMKLTPDEKAELIRVSTPVIASRLPTDLEGAGEMSPEELLLTTAAFIYGPKYFSPEPAAQEPKSPSGGGEQKPEGSASSGTPTEASVDGRKVDATVHELPKKKAS